MRLEKEQNERERDRKSEVEQSKANDTSYGSLQVPSRVKKLQSTNNVLDQSHSNVGTTHFFRDESRVDGSAESKE